MARKSLDASKIKLKKVSNKHMIIFTYICFLGANNLIKKVIIDGAKWQANLTWNGNISVIKVNIIGSKSQHMSWHKRQNICNIVANSHPPPSKKISFPSATRDLKWWYNPKPTDLWWKYVELCWVYVEFMLSWNL